MFTKHVRCTYHKIPPLGFHASCVQLRETLGVPRSWRPGHNARAAGQPQHPSSPAGRRPNHRSHREWTSALAWFPTCNRHNPRLTIDQCWPATPQGGEYAAAALHTARHVRSFVRPSESPRSYKDWGGSWVTCCCKTVHTLVRKIAILAESVQLCPMTSENSSSQIFLNCHPSVWMDDLAYAWVQWKNFAATHWLESTCLLLQPRNFVDRKFLLRHETACRISARTMVCIPKSSLQKQFSYSSGTWYRTNLHRHVVSNQLSIEAFSVVICPRCDSQILSKAG